MVDQLSSFADEVTRVAREVGTEGKLGGQAEVKGVSGTWKDLTDNVNSMACNLTAQVRNIAEVTTAVANGDLSQEDHRRRAGEMLELKNTDQHDGRPAHARSPPRSRASRARSAPKASSAARPRCKGVSGTWKDLTDNVNFMAGNLTGQVRNIAQVTTAVANGDLSKKITVDVKGEILELKNTINTMVDQLRSFAAEVTRVAREVGTEGKLGGQAEVRGRLGRLEGPDRQRQLHGRQPHRARCATSPRSRPPSPTATSRRRSPSTPRARSPSSKNTINTMVDQLRSFAGEVTRVAREVGTEGKLGGQAERARASPAPGRTSPTTSTRWPATSPSQVRNIAKVTTAVANGDLSQEDHRRRRGRDPRAQGHHQHDGRPALGLRRGGHPRGARGRHRGQAGRPGGGEGRRRHLEGPDRQRQLAWRRT